MATADYGIQQLQELTNTDDTDFATLLATYRAQYTRGWNASRDGRPAWNRTDAYREGYEDNEMGLSKWTAISHHGILDGR
jgi:hypothetical protein